VVLAISEGSVESTDGEQVVSRIRLSRGARSWTPSLGSCLEHGGRYAWSVRALTERGEGEWSAPALFRVTAAPSLQEVEAAMAILRRHLAERRQDGGGSLPVPAVEALETDAPGIRLDARLRERLAAARVQRAAAVEGRALRMAPAEPGSAALQSDGSGVPALIVSAAVPALGSPSLSVSANVVLGAASNVFKDGAVFLWDDPSGNTALGREALASATGTATGNTAVGRRALKHTTGGIEVYHGRNNTAVGDGALYENTTGGSNTATGHTALLFNTTGFGNTAAGVSALRFNTTGSGNTASGYTALGNNVTGYSNTASGEFALASNTSGSFNTASGALALVNNTTGSRNTATGDVALAGNTTGSANTAVGNVALLGNTEGDRNVAIGYRAGFNVTGANRDDNIFISNEGTATDSNRIRIGTQGNQDGTFIAGIHGTTVTGSTVLVTADGQLGVASSSAIFKEEVEELGEIGERLATLRPVTFRYRSEILPEGGPQIGLIAEEVAEIFPELVTRDAEGRPFGVRYDLLSVLSLAELQHQVAINRAQGEELAEQRRELAQLDALRERVVALEVGEPRPPQRRTPSRRRAGSQK
jgi:hypothetical protein